VRQYKLKKCKRVHGVHFTPDGSRLLAVGGDEVQMVNSAVWLELATGENIGRIDQLANCYAVDPQLARYAIGGARGFDVSMAEVQWTTLEGELEWQTFQPKKAKKPPVFEEVAALAFDPVGKRLAISHDPNNLNGELIIVHRDTGQSLAEAVIVGNMNNACFVLAFNAKGTRIAGTGGMDGDPIVEVFDTKSGAELHNFQAPGTATRSVIVLPDNRIVVATARNVYVADETTTLFTLAGHKGQVNALALTPDGRRILSASHDGAIRTWDANTGEAGPAFEWGIGPVTALAFAPDGLTAAAAGLNGKVVVWDVDG
jgi:WD40 repeat protein